METNPANGIKDLMWKFLMDKGQKENIPELKASVYRLIKMTTQKTAGQRKATAHISWETLDMQRRNYDYRNPNSGISTETAEYCNYAESRKDHDE